MVKAIPAILRLAVGIVIGGTAALTGGGGAMAGSGVVTGLSAGICSTVQAVVEEGLLTSEQVLMRTSIDVAARTGKTVEGEIVGSSDACAGVPETLRTAAG